MQIDAILPVELIAISELAGIVPRNVPSAQVFMSPVRFVSFAFLLALAVFFFSAAQSAPV